MGAEARMRRLRLAGALWLAFAPGLALAAIPTGSFDFTLGGNQSIWVEEGDESEAEAAFCAEFAATLGDVEFCEFAIHVDGKGKIAGFVDFAAWSDGILIAMSGPIKGSQRGNGATGFSSASYSIKLAGEASDGNVTLGLKANLAFAGQVAPGGVASGYWDARFCLQGEPCESFRTYLPTETLTNGDWQVELEIADAGGGALSGSARIEFGDGSECLYDLRGRYSAKSDAASLALTPITPDCAGTSIQLRDVAIVEPLLAPRSRNQEVFDFICAGTVTITASADVAACAWSLLSDLQGATAGSEPALRIGQMRYKLFGFSGQGFVHSVGDVANQSFGRREFTWVPNGSTIFTVVSNTPWPDTLFHPIASEPFAR